MNNLRIIGTKMNNLRKHCLIVTVHKDFCTLHCMHICKELTLPKAVVLGVNLKAQGCAEVMAINYPTHACTARGKVIEFVHCLLSVCQPKILRWRELATSRASEHIRSFENTPIILTCTCYWADSLPLTGISAVFLLSGPVVSHFIYG